MIRSSKVGSGTQSILVSMASRKAPSRPVAAAPSSEQARLKDELEQAQHRERQLELVAAEASAALGRAAAEVRAALAAEG